MELIIFFFYGDYLSDVLFVASVAKGSTPGIYRRTHEPLVHKIKKELTLKL